MFLSKYFKHVNALKIYIFSGTLMPSKDKAFFNVVITASVSASLNF